MKNIIKIFVTIAVCVYTSLFTCFSQSYNAGNNENVIAQMNYCINSLTKIINNQSMIVLEHESDQILNNLTMEHISGLSDIRDFRIELLDVISNFQITEEERRLLRRVQSIQRDNMKWTAISNALNPTMLLTGMGPGMGYQLAFQTLITAARATVEYKSMQGEQNIEELRAMWDLRKEDLKKINDSRKEALRLVYNLYTKYNLNEYDRLTESTAEQFNEFISEQDAAKRIRLLEQNKDIYEKMADYYYHLGMAYIDVGDYNKAKLNFIVYEHIYNKVPLLRYDEKSGCIALTRLTYEKNLSDDEKKQLIEVVLRNLPNNSAAFLQCAMVYLYELKDSECALKLIRRGIDDPKATDRQLLYMAAANLLPAINDLRLKHDISELFGNHDKYSLDAYVTFLMNTKENAWEDISKLIRFENIYYRKWYTLWISKSFNDELRIIFPPNIVYNADDVSLYVEKHSKNRIDIRQLKVQLEYGVLIDEINDIDCFKENQNLKFLFFDVLIPDKVFLLKEDLNYEQIKKSELPRMTEFQLSSDDIDDIINFCKKHAPKTRETVLSCEYSENELEICNDSDGLVTTFIGDSLKYTPIHTESQEGLYLKIILANNNQLMYYYMDYKLIPYYYKGGDNIIYNNLIVKEDFEQEYVKQGLPWYSNFWKNIKGLFIEKKDSTDNKSVNIVEETTSMKESWYIRLWNNIKGLFSNEESSSEGNSKRKPIKT